MAKPALVTAQPNLLELVRQDETGLAFRLDEPSSFIEGVNRLCNDELRMMFSGAAIQRARQAFDSRTNVERTMAIYERLLTPNEIAHERIGSAREVPQ